MVITTKTMHGWVIAGRMIWAAGSSFGLALSFLIAWIAPDTLGDLTVHRLVFLMLLEFLVVHSSGFLGAIAARDASIRMRLAQFIGLLLIYSLFAAAFSLSYGGWWPLTAFLMLTLNKFPSVVLRPPDMTGQTIQIVNWAAMTAFFLTGALLTAVLPVPAWGVTPDVIARQAFGIGGLWPEEPYRVMAFGAGYFTALGILALINEGVCMMLARRSSARRESSEGWLPPEA